MSKDVIAVSEPSKLTPLDEQTFGNMSQMIKASVPYMSPQAARPMAMLARLMELQNTINYFRLPGKVRACSIGSRRPSPEEMLLDLRKYCSGNEAKMIDTLLNAMKIGKFYEKFKDMENNPEFSQLFQALSSVQGMNPFQNAAFAQAMSQAQEPCSGQAADPGGTYIPASNTHGGETMKPSINPEQVLKNINPELLKNIDLNKFNQLVQAINSGNFPGSEKFPFSSFQNDSLNSRFQGNKNSYRQSEPDRESSPPAFETPVSGFNEERLKALLSPEQLQLYESLKKSMT